MKADISQVNSNTNLLQQYDILSVQPTSDKALQLACNDLCAPGPNQVSPFRPDTRYETEHTSLAVHNYVASARETISLSAQ
jgi:hypothetical protein